MLARILTKSRHELRRLRERILGSAHPAESEPYGPIQALLSYPEAAVAPVAYLGDSVLERVSRTDADVTTLADLLQADLRARAPLLRLSHTACHPGLFHVLAELLESWPRRPQALVIAVNLRCFAPQWDLNPQWQFDERIRAVQAFRSAPSDVAPSVPPIETTVRRDPAFEGIAVDYPYTTCRTIRDFREIIFSTPQDDAGVRARWRELFIFHYMHRLGAQHRRLNSLTAAVDVCRRAGIPCVVYLTPINHEAGVRLVGAEFAERLAENARVVLSAIRQSTAVTVHDWSRELEEECFFHPNDPTEHLAWAGRRHLAALVAEAVRAALAPRRPP